MTGTLSPLIIFSTYLGLPGEKGERGPQGNGVRGQRGPNGPPGTTIVFSFLLSSAEMA